MFSWDDWKSWISNVFLKPLKSRIDSLRSRNQHFYTWVTPLPIEMNVHIANIFWQVPQIPAPCPLASKIIISNSSLLQGRRANRLPCFFSEISGCSLLISVKFGEWISSEIFETCCLYVCVFLIFHQKIRALTWFKHELSRFYKNHGFAAASQGLFDSYFHQVGGCEVTGTAPRRLANRCCGCVNRSIRLQWSCGLGWCWNEDHPASRS